MSALFVSMFMLGLVTSVHCVSMCGPMVVTYAVKGEEDGPWYRKLIPNGAYQAAKIVSYMLVGLAVGAIGSAFNLDAVRPYVMLVAGAFMIVMGLGMTGKFPWAARLTPRPPKFLMQALVKTRRKATADAEAGESSLATPVTFGLLTGLMPCAPLMAAQLAAAGTGSVLGGGFAMLAFGLGTAPLMLVFGTASSMLPKNFKARLMSVLAIVVIAFGAVYVNRGLTRLGSPVTFNTVRQAVVGGPAVDAVDQGAYTVAADGVTEVPLTIVNTQFNPQVLQIPADKPVRLIIDRQEEGACSDQLAIPQLGVLANLTPNGVTVVDLPGSAAGNYTLTCGMGMMSGQLAVGGAPARSGGTSPILLIAVFGAAIGFSIWRLRRRMPADQGSKTPAPAPAHARSHSSTARGTSSGKGHSGSSGRPTTHGRPGARPVAAPARILGFAPAEAVLIVTALGAAVVLGLVTGGLIG